MFSKAHQMGAPARVPPFPYRQLFVLALCRICEPIAFMSIFPYIYYMIRSFEITDDETQIALYAGMVTSSFALAECLAGVVWGRLSDRIGRKPVLISGLAGTGLSMLIFGFAPNLKVALLARALGGLLNGNIGVLQTTVAELVTVKEHQPRAYAVMPFVWSLGSILGPALGGILAQPCITYPSVFHPGTIFEKFPYLLPNLVCTFIVVCGVVIGILFLEETHEEKRLQRDIGLEAGNRILSVFRLSTWRGAKKGTKDWTKTDDAIGHEKYSLLEEELPPGYSSNESSPTLAPSSPPSLPTQLRRSSKRRTVKSAFTRQVILNIVGYGILAYHTMSFEQLLPVFLSMPKSDVPPSLPFKFLGGFGLSPHDVGLIASLQGCIQMPAQLFLFPYVVGKLGPLRTFRYVIFSYPILYFIIPYLSLLPGSLKLVGIPLVLIWKVTGQVLAYPSQNILLANSAPSMLLLGAINGAAASTASLSRALGPTVSGMVQAWGLNLGFSAFAWWACGFVAVIGAVESLFWREVDGREDDFDQTLTNDDDLDLEAACPYLDGSASISETTLVAAGSPETEDKMATIPGLALPEISHQQ